MSDTTKCYRGLRPREQKAVYFLLKREGMDFERVQQILVSGCKVRIVMDV